jgi:predicted enzyme related to lactoylglutathione lyase
MASVIRAITVDCANPARLAEFWAAALDYKLQEADDEGALIVDSRHQGTRMLFLKVPEGKAVKNRVHLDLGPTDTHDAEVDRLLKLGARVFKSFRENNSGWTVMQDPEGNEFCVESGMQELKGRGQAE